MRKLYSLTLSLLLIVTLSACKKSNVDDETADLYTNKAKDAIELLLDLNYEEVHAQFNEEMKELLPVSDMNDLTPLIEKVGDFEEYEVSAVEERDGYYVTVVVTKHENGKLGFTVSFEEDGRIAGLFIK